MRVPQTLTDDTNLFIDECENASHLSSKQEIHSKSSSTSEHIYTEIVKAIRTKKFNEEKSSLKRASWSPAEYHECGLPPTGRRTDGEAKNGNRVRMRPRPTRNFQLQQSHQTAGVRPVSFNERFERLPNSSLNRNGNLSNQRHQSPSSTDTLIQITKHISTPSVDKSDASSVTTTTPPDTNLSIATSAAKRPLLVACEHSPSSSVTCQKGQEELSPTKGSSLNQYPELTSQIESIDSSRDDRCHPTTRRLMTMSISPNRLHNQTHSSITNITNGLKQEQNQTKSIPRSVSCLKSNRSSRTRKSVHFDWNPPIEIQSTANHYHPSVTVTSPPPPPPSNNDGETTVEEQERRTTSPLTTYKIHRSFSLSPSPLTNNEENNRRHRQQVKKENVDQLNCITSSRGVTFNDNISSNGMTEKATQPMPLNTLLVKTASFNSSNGLLNFLNRTNSKVIPIQKKSKRFSADVESLSNEQKVTANHRNTRDNPIDLSNSISMCTKTMKSNEDDSINNAFLFKPVQSSTVKETFYLSAPKSTDDSSMNTMMQTSTLIISTPPQYHYYLYPPTIGKKNAKTNISMNSISTNSSSSSSASPSSYDPDDDSFSYSNYSIINNPKPVILSDSVQNFWPPPPSPTTLNNDPEQIITEQNKQSPSNTLMSSTYNDDSLFVGNGNQTDGLPPTMSLMLNNKEEGEDVRSYSEQGSFDNRYFRKESDSSFEDTQTSYSERLREKSRSIKPPVAMNVNSYSLSRSRSKDNLNQQSNNNINSINRTTSRPKSAGQVRAQVLLSPLRQEISNDFQSKRQFFENRTYTDYVPLPPPTANNRIYTNSPVNHLQRHVAKCSWNDSSSARQQPTPPPQTDSTIRTTKYFDTSSNQVSVPPTVYRKPVRIVKAVQRSAPSPTINDLQCSLPMKSTTDGMHLSSQYIRNLFPAPDRMKRNRSRQNSENTDLRNMPSENNRQTEDLLFNLNKQLEILRDNQRIINDEIEVNNSLGTKLMKIIESKAESNEFEKLKLHINEIETITFVLLKLSCRLAKVENDLSSITNDNAHTKATLLEQREKIQEKHEEAKALKDGIDRRSGLVTRILRKYLSEEQFDDYEHFIRMKSTLLMDGKDLEEHRTFLQKQIQLLRHFNPLDRLQTNFCQSISTKA